MNRPESVVLGTGGTLAGSSSSTSDNIGCTAAALGIVELLAGIDSLRDAPLLAEQMAQINSKDMDQAVWTRLAQRCAHWLAQDEVRRPVAGEGADRAAAGAAGYVDSAASARWVISSTLPVPLMRWYLGAPAGSALAQAE